MATDQFAEFRTEKKPDDAAYAQLSEMVKGLDAAEQEVLSAEAALKAAQEKMRRIEEFDLPQFMESLGLKSFKSTSGLEIEVVKKIRASIGDRKVQAFAWLIKNGHGGLIKRTVEVAFNTDQGKQAEELCLTLSQQTNAGVRQNMKVEPATLVSWVTKQLEAGNEVPADLFGVFEQKFAKIKREE